MCAKNHEHLLSKFFIFKGNSFLNFLHPEREVKINEKMSIIFLFHFTKSVDRDMNVDRRSGALSKRIASCISPSANRNEIFKVQCSLVKAAIELDSCRRFFVKTDDQPTVLYNWF